MKKAFLVLSVVAASLTSHALVVQWWQEMLDLSPKVIEAYHGEKITFNVGLRNGGAYVNPTGYTVTFYWQTSDMGENWWSKEGRIYAFDNPWAIGAKSTDKAVIADFSPSTDDPGVDVLNCFFRVEGLGEQHYRVHFTLRMQTSPGYTPNNIEVPRRVLDFNTTTITNAPYYTKSEVDALCGEVGDGVSEGLKIKYYTKTGDYKVGQNWASDREWRYGESLGNVAKVLRFGDKQKIRISGTTYPMEYFAPNWHDFYSMTANPNSGGHTSRLTPDDSPVQTAKTVSNLVTRAFVERLGITAGGGQSAGVDASAIIAATNALATTTAAKIVGATNNLHATQIKTSVDSYSSSFETVEDTLQSIGYALDAMMVTDNMLEEGKANANQVYTRNESDQRFYPKASGDAWAAFWDGDEVRVTVTNYFGQANLPHLYLEQKTNTTGTAKYKIVWDEHTRWRKFVGDNFNWSTWSGFYNFKTNATARLDDLDANKADRAWGFYDSSTGEYAPEHYTSVSSSNLMIAAGLAYQRTVTTGGAAVWVLTATEPTSVSGTGNGAFQIKDADGNVQVEIVKGDKRTVGARCGGVSVSGTALVAEYAVASAEHPTLEVCADLANPVWKAEGTTGCPATVAWSGTSGAWVATITPSAGATKIFAKASYQVGGDSVFKSNVAMKFAQIVIGSTTYNIGTATVSGNTVLTLTPAL